MPETTVNNPAEQTGEKSANALNPQTPGADGLRAKLPAGTPMPLPVAAAACGVRAAFFVGILYLLIKLWPACNVGRLGGD